MLYSQCLISDKHSLDTCWVDEWVNEYHTEEFYYLVKTMGSCSTNTYFISAVYDTGFLHPLFLSSIKIFTILNWYLVILICALFIIAEIERFSYFYWLLCFELLVYVLCGIIVFKLRRKTILSRRSYTKIFLLHFMEKNTLVRVALFQGETISTTLI